MMTMSRTGPTPPARRNAGRGFTLIEILLALGVIVMMIGIMALAVGGWISGRTLENGATQVESALRLARADAANQGRRLRLVFPGEAAAPKILWEPDPLAAPGEFVDYGACTWRECLAVDGLQVSRCDPMGPSLQRPADWGGQEVSDKSATAAAITFEPDGSSDSAVIELTVTGSGDSRRAVLLLDGQTGRIETTLVAEEASSSSQP
jgi:type II secretory pathway pseudopilin PulG